MLPIALRPDGRPVAIVGGGRVATRKARALLDAGFAIFVVAPEIDGALLAMLEGANARFERRAYRRGDLDGARLAIAATGDDGVDAGVAGDARAAGIPCCDASRPERGDFSMSATLRLGGLTVAVDSGGSPAFSKRVLADVAAALGPQYGEAAATMARMRAYVKAIVPAGERTGLLRALAAIPVHELAALNAVQAEHRVEDELAHLRGTAGERAATSSVTCASRGSALALTQTRTVAARLAQRGIATTILTVTTAGDRDRDRAIDRLGSVNVFVKELEVALREGRADYAVHSCKDLPSELPHDMQLAAISARHDARDAFCSERYASFDALPAGAVVGTSSPRRRALLAALRPDVRYENLRGNVDTRLRKLREGAYDAIVLAMAGLERLNARATHTVPFEPDDLVPAVGQGALAVETRATDAALSAHLRAAINDDAAELCVTCERAALRALRAGCSAPIGIHARLREDGTLIVTGAYAGAGGAVRRARIETAAGSLEEAAAAGERIAGLLEAPAKVIVLARSQERPSRIAHALRDRGVRVIEVAAGDAGPDPAEATPDMLLFPSSGSVAAAETYLARLRQRAHRPFVVAMGPRSGEAARDAGFAPDAVSEEASIDAFLDAIAARLEGGA